MSTSSFLVFFTLCVAYSMALDCSAPGWTNATDICYRVVHHPKSFWAAKTECQEFEGQLLRLKNTKQVMAAIGDSMVGNAEDFRIDGWSDGVWYHKEKDAKEVLKSDNHEFLRALSMVTLTINLEDGQISGNRHADAQLGFICEGQSGVGTGSQGCANDE